MWSMIKEWFNRNKAYLAMIFLSSLAIGVGIAVLSAFYPVVLPAFTGVVFFGVTPLAFLATLSAPLAIFTLSCIVTALSSVLIAASVTSMQQLVSISSHVGALFLTGNERDVVPSSEASYNFLNKYLHVETPEQFDEVDEDEFHELSSDSSEEPKPAPLDSPEPVAVTEPEPVRCSM